jgi:hypothetical protein
MTEAPYIAEIRRLARAFRDNERNLPLYFPDFDTPPPVGSYNRVFGSPVGITDLDWPVYPQLGELLAQSNQLSMFDAADLRMEHVFTVDLRDIRLLGAPPRAHAMALFISNANANGASQNGNADTAVVFLSEDELVRGEYGGPLPRRSRSRASRRFSLVRVDVPGDVFDMHDEETSPIGLLHDAIWQAPARLGGCPIWVRDPTDPRDFTPSGGARRVPGIPGPRGRNAFVMQFEQRFANVNLGKHGVMYVSGVGAYYQGYE